MQITSKTEISADLWNQFLTASSRASFLQSWEFGEFYKGLGLKVWRLGLFAKNNLEGIGLLVKQETRFGSFLYCPGGPLLNHFEEGLKGFLVAARDIAKKEGCGLIRLDPRLVSEAEVRVLQAQSLKKAAVYTQPQCSLVLDLTQGLDEIKSGLSDSTRYNIGWVDRKGVAVEISQNPGDFDTFISLLADTANRHGFKLWRRTNYYKEQFLAFQKDGKAKLFVAHAPKEFGNQVLAAAVVVYLGDTVTYLHAASSSNLRNLRAPYLMQWKIIEDAKNSGYKNYDFWGVAATESPSDPWAGVSAFKKSFGGERVCYQPPFDLPVSGQYYLLIFVEKLRSLAKLFR